MSTNRSAVRDLLDLAAAGSTISKSDYDDLPTPEDVTNRGAWLRVVAAAVDECQHLHRAGQHASARRHAAEIAGRWDVPEAEPFRTDTRGKSPDELAALIER